MNHIVSRTASHADQHQLHGTRSRAAPLRPESRSKHDLVPGPGLANERAVFNPFDPCFHQSRPSAMGLLPGASLTSSNPLLAHLAENWHRPSSIRQDAHFGPAEPENNPPAYSAPRIGSADGALRWVRNASSISVWRTQGASSYTRCCRSVRHLAYGTDRALSEIGPRRGCRSRP